MPFCAICSISVGRKCWTGHLRSNAHKRNNENFVKLHCEGIELVSTAFRNRIATYRILADERDFSSIDGFFNSIGDKLKTLLDSCFDKNICFKINLEYFAKFILFKNNTEEIKSFLSKNKVLYQNYDFDVFFSNITTLFKEKVESFEHQDSGWSFLHNSHLEVNINKYEPLGGSSFIKLPQKIKNKKACLNIQNKDNCCFLWCITAALYPARSHPERVSSYPNFRDVVNINDIQFPVTFSDIKIFERNNSHLRVIVYGLKNNKTIVGPLYNSDKKDKSVKTVHLLLLENASGTQHYCLIKNLPKLVRSQMTAHHGKLFFCETCLVFFSNVEDLDNHVCSGIVTVLPEKGAVIEFKHFERKQNVPFVIYADFESLLEPNSDVSDSCNTSTLHHHKPAAFAYYIVCCDEDLNRYVSHRGPDCVDMFIKCIFEDMKKIHKILNDSVKMIYTESNAIDFQNATCCYICEHFLFFDKVRDHCHITGRYRGAAHSLCNLRLQNPSFVPIFFHNLSGYDCHLFIKKLGEAPGVIKIIPKTKENYISFTKYIAVENHFFQLRFVDSFKFLGASLDKLTKTLHGDSLKNLRHFFQDDEKFELISRKGVYPYEYMNKWERYEETSLPPKDSFYNCLTNEHISNTDYLHAKTVWSTFNMNNLGEYTDLYLKTDVLLLTDIFENFRKTCRHHYNLDPAFYLSAPSLSFDAMLLKTGIQLELIDNLMILKMIQAGIRGGICMVSHRHVEANNTFLPDYDPVKPDTFIVYIDCNNLYGYSMSQYLPLSDFHFIERNEIDFLNIMEVPDDSMYGYILEVDLIYPQELHDTHDDLPFCPEKCIPPGGKTEKLVPNLYDKYFYVIHYIHLKTCLKHGLKMNKIHRVIKFLQSPYLKKYIDLNTHLRQQATSTFEQDFFKLLNNSIFGKTLENNEKRVDVKLVNIWSDEKNTTKKKTSAARLIARSNFHSASVFSENLVAIQLNPNRIVLDKPIYIGFTVLELSKSHMYDFHYSVVKPVYGNRVKMCYTDTDSFIYRIQTKDFFQDLRQKFISYFDTSNYPENNNYNIPLRNKKVPGLFKDESASVIITNFVALRSKLYCVKTVDNLVKKAKGVKKSVVNKLNLSDYNRTLYQGNTLRKTNVFFKSIKHEIYTQKVKKVALSANDDKRLISADKVSTKAWGNCSILFPS